MTCPSLVGGGYGIGTRLVSGGYGIGTRQFDSRIHIFNFPTPFQVGLFSKAAFGLCPDGLPERETEPSAPPHLGAHVCRHLALHPVFTPQPTLLPSVSLSWDTPTPSLLTQPCLGPLVQEQTLTRGGPH